MKNSIYRLAAGLSAILCSTNAWAEVIPFDDERWTLGGENTEQVVYKGEDALYAYYGNAILRDVEFTDGIIEYDVLLPNADRGFSGVIWRLQEDSTYENFYIRPHQSGMPDSNQYTPDFTGSSGWQLYFGPHYSAPTVYKFDDWMHIKLVVSGDQAEVYIDSDEPVLFIDDLKADVGAGAIGLSTAFAPVYFANFSYEAIDAPALMGQALPAEELPENLITHFDVSEVVADDAADPSDYMGDWMVQDIETMGAVNLSRYRARSEGHNTILVRLRVTADSDTVKRFTFGYSDDVVVYINGQPISGGTNIYQTRDYRYLGTVGLFDDVYLPLKEGENEVYFAIKENFGGWAFMGRFDDMTGLIVE